MSGLISKAKEGLAKSKSKADVLKSPTGDSLPKLQEAKKSENELHWEELVKKLKRPLELCDLDFTDLNSDDEVDVLGPVNVTNGIPPPPPPMVPTAGGVRAPPPPPLGARLPPPVPQAPPPLFGVNLKLPRSPTAAIDSGNMPKSPPPAFTKKSKKTVKLFWKEVRDDPIILSRLDKNKMIWDELSPVPVDTQKLEHLFESRAKDLITKVSRLFRSSFKLRSLLFSLREGLLSLFPRGYARWKWFLVRGWEEDFTFLRSCSCAVFPGNIWIFVVMGKFYGYLVCVVQSVF